MRLVDADALDNVVQVLNEKKGFGITGADKKMIDSVLFEFPTMDAVEVVHCEECAYRRRCMLQHFVISNAVDSRKIDWSEWYCADGVRDDKATK